MALIAKTLSGTPVDRAYTGATMYKAVLITTPTTAAKYSAALYTCFASLGRPSA
ncbi:hypothetical protein D3C75_1270530 [compost metagenome]